MAVTTSLARQHTPSAPVGAQGFTLLELLVVLAILAMMATAVPSLLTSLPGIRLRAATDDMVTVLRTLHDQAIGRGTTMELVLDPAARSYTVSTDKKVRTFPPIVEAVRFQRTVSVRVEQHPSIRFFPDGSATDGTFLMSGRNREYGIVIDWVTGHVWRRD